MNISKKLGEIDDKTIKDIVRRILENPDINCNLLPDAIEGKLYENIIRIILGLLKETLDTTRIDFLGHHIEISFQNPN
jgi:hypothetical protein